MLGAYPSLFAAIPFFILLAIIAFLPLIGNHLWTKLYPYFSFGMATLTFIYYYFLLHNIVPLIHAFYEYLSFIVLIGSLFVIAGGIHINIRARSSPFVNASLLALGALAANLVGTTGASIILIRPYIRINKGHVKPYHIAFFIFIVSNVGGILTPVGDPPLFIGYLKGIPFFWPVVNLWHFWLLSILITTIIFYFVDLKTSRKLETAHFEPECDLRRCVELSGIHNLIFLGFILAAIFISNSPLLRIFVMAIAALASYVTTKKEVHEKNEFGFAPIKEISLLFFGIFITMVPALEWISLNAASFG
ncbi:MAG: sodium:proton antiporter, partial [Candidatus Kryptoniota bacterium]